MRISLLVSFIFLVSCNSSKISSNKYNFIPYIFSKSVEDSLAKRIEKDNKKYYFLLTSKKDIFSIYIDSVDDSSSYLSWIKISGRKIYIDGMFYPLLFESDFYFGVTTSARDFLSEVKIEKYPLLKKSAILLHGYHVDFDISGKPINEQ